MGVVVVVVVVMGREVGGSGISGGGVVPQEVRLCWRKERGVLCVMQEVGGMVSTSPFWVCSMQIVHARKDLEYLYIIKLLV